MAATEKPAPAFADVYVELQKISQSVRTFNRLVTTEAKIAQTPKEVIWTFNKAKLYHYVPAVPEEKRHKLPLFLVFAIMNRPHVLDLRPGHSFVEYMLRHGYDLYLLDWGAPGPEDRNLKFDDYTLEYLPRAIRKLFCAIRNSLRKPFSTMFTSLRSYCRQRWTPWFPVKRASTTVLWPSSRCHPIFQLCTYPTLRFGTKSLTLVLDVAAIG